jgi:hypothetical protein
MRELGIQMLALWSKIVKGPKTKKTAMGIVRVVKWICPVRYIDI